MRICTKAKLAKAHALNILVIASGRVGNLNHLADGAELAGADTVMLFNHGGAANPFEIGKRQKSLARPAFGMRMGLSSRAG